MGQALFGLGVVDAGVPAADELLDRGDVDHAVMQMGVQRRHVAGDEAAVGGDGVAGERCGADLGDVLADVVEDALLGFFKADHGSADLFGEPRMCVHLADDLGHPGELLLVGVDDDVDAVAEDVQLGVGHQCRDFDQRVLAEVEPGHLAVDPD